MAAANESLLRQIPVLLLFHGRAERHGDGLVLGSNEFVKSVFTENRDKFGPKRQDGVRKVSPSESR
jgi:hypothetical protein